MASHDGSRMNLSSSYTPAASRSWGHAPVPGPRPRAQAAWSDTYVKLHDQPVKDTAVSYADVLRRQARPAPAPKA